MASLRVISDDCISGRRKQRHLRFDKHAACGIFRSLIKVLIPELAMLLAATTIKPGVGFAIGQVYMWKQDRAVIAADPLAFRHQIICVIAV